MSYRTQVKQAALDRALQYAKMTADIKKEAPDIESVFKTAGKIEKHMYSPIDDIRDMAKTLFDLFAQNLSETELLTETIQGLQMLEEQQLNTLGRLNKMTAEKVQ